MTAPAPAPRGRVLETERLLLREFSENDAQLALDVLNDADFIRYVADRGVRTLDDARKYLREGPIASQTRLGFSLYAVALKDGSADVGVCGLVRRDGLDDVDLGYGFLPAYRGRGFAVEAAHAVLAYATGTLGLTRVVAIVDPDNTPSVKVLERVGMAYERMIRLGDGDTELRLYAYEVPRG